MKLASSEDYLLTSLVVTPSIDGNYSFYTKALLYEHEAIRRSLLIGEKVVENVDFIKNSWKALAFHEWLTFFLFPILNIHQKFEDELFFPFYKAAGTLIPVDQSEQHTALSIQISSIISTSSSILVSLKLTDNKLQVSAYQSVLKKKFVDLANQIREHFAIEEEFWPQIIKKFGKVSKSLLLFYCTYLLFKYFSSQYYYIITNNEYIKIY
jgi:hypothetical protein